MKIHLCRSDFSFLHILASSDSRGCRFDVKGVLAGGLCVIYIISSGPSNTGKLIWIMGMNLTTTSQLLQTFNQHLDDWLGKTVGRGFAQSAALSRKKRLLKIYQKSELCLNEHRREQLSQQPYTDCMIWVLKDLQICFYIMSHDCHIWKSRKLVLRPLENVFSHLWALNCQMLNF